MSYPILQSSTQAPLLFFMVDSSDHITGKTGLTCTVTISKAGGSFASPSGAVSEIANGWYKVAGNATDTGTLGPIALHATATGADPCDIVVGHVVAYDPQSALATPTNITAGTITTTTNLTNLPSIPNNWLTAAGIAASALNGKGDWNVGKTGYTVSTVSDKTGYSLSASQTFDVTGNITGNLSGSVGSVTGAVGSVTGAVGSVTGNVGGNVAGSVASVTAAVAITSNIKKNQALAGFTFLMTDSTNHAPATGLTVSVTRSIDGGAFAAGTLSAVTEVSNGIYSVDFASGDLNGKTVILRATATGADDRFERIVTQA